VKLGRVVAGLRVASSLLLVPGRLAVAGHRFTERLRTSVPSRLAVAGRSYSRGSKRNKEKKNHSLKHLAFFIFSSLKA
jgi:predicted RNase H-like nuclease